MKFMLMMNAPKGDGDWNVLKWPAEAFKAHIGFMKELNLDLANKGVLVGCEGLAPPGEARIVRVKPNVGGAPEVTDGPFAESKEFLAGYWIVKVDTVDQAYAIAARVSSAPGIDGKPLGIPVEVREVQAAPPTDLA